MNSTIQQSVIDNLREFSTPARPVYLVGGAVRDFLLGREVHDLDFVLPGGTRKLANELACRLNGAVYVLDEERDTTRVVLNLGDGHARLLVDFATLRAGDLEGDLRARDFTVNALAYDVAYPDRLIDPLGGLADLREKLLRACSPDSLSADPVRVLRAVRQALALQFRIAPQTLDWMRAAAPLLPRVSAERQRDELLRMLDGQRVHLAIRILDRVGALQFLLPELDALKGVSQSAPHTLDVWEHTLSVVQHLEQLLAPLVGAYREETVTDLTTGSAVLKLGRYRERFVEHFEENMVPDRSLRALLFLAALYHDIAKPQARSEGSNGRTHFYGHDNQGAEIAAHRARALALSVQEIDRVKDIVFHHMRIHQLAGVFQKEAQPAGNGALTRRSIYRFFKDTRAAGVDICLLSLADTRGTYGFTLPQETWDAELSTCRSLLEGYWERSEQVVSPPRWFTGSDVISEFSLAPGPLIGRILEAVREAQATGEITNRAEALQYIRQWLPGHAELNKVSPKAREDET